MRTFGLLLPAGLALLALAAHALRRMELAGTLACLMVFALLFVRRPWAARVIQAALVLGALEWLRTLAVLLPGRRAAGEPWVRMAVILGAAALISAAAALLLEAPALRARFGHGRSRPAP